MAVKLYSLSPAEWEIILRGLEDPNLLMRYWFAHPDGRCFQFDSNFTDDGKWQTSATLAQQHTIVIIGGVGTGKTLWGGMQASYKGIITNGYKFLNVAPKAWQSKIMFDEIVKWMEGTPFEKLVYKIVERPYPKIFIGFQYQGYTHRASLEFMSVADDAIGIFSWRGDEIFVEEAGLHDNLEETITNLWTRLTGSTPGGRAFFGRMILASNPWDNTHLWKMADQALDDPDDCVTMVLSTRNNKNVTDDQVRRLIANIPESDRGRFLDGTRPEGRSKWINIHRVVACEDTEANTKVEAAATNGDEWYRVIRQRGIGVTEFTTPPRVGMYRMLLGDPGVKAAPDRDSPVLMVWEVPYTFPAMPMELKAFWWGNGDGEITRFVKKLMAWGGLDSTFELQEPNFDPKFIGIDSTGPQKGIATLLNMQIAEFTEEAALLGTTKISGMDFSVNRKTIYLMTLRLFLENGLMKWPQMVTGIRSQISNYDPQEDRGSFPRRPQDIVAAMSMSAYAAKVIFHVDDEVLTKSVQIPQASFENPASRFKRNSGNRRIARGRRNTVQAV